MGKDGNRMRWDRRRRGHYEGWFVAFNDPQAGAGYWIRYSLVSPTDGGREPIAQAWFMRTDRAANPRHRALRTTFPVAGLTTSTAPFRVDVGGNVLSEAGCSGELEDAAGRVSWELSFESLAPGFAPTPEWGARVATCFLEPHPLVRISGQVTENGVSRSIDGWMGSQAHVFGARHSERWHWAECKHLGPGRFFTGVAAWPRFPRRTVTSLALVGAGHELSRTRTPDLFRAETSHSAAQWRFDAEYGLDRLAGEVTPNPEDLVGVTYHDPSGLAVYCYHSELADISLRRYTRQSRNSAWRVEENLEVAGGAAFEYGSLTPLPGIRLLLD